MKYTLIKVIDAPSTITWWYRAIGQFATVHEIYKPTGFMKVRLMLPILEYDWIVEKPYDRYRQIEGWIDPEFVEIVEG